jgi:hypothetical protein
MRFQTVLERTQDSAKKVSFSKYIRATMIISRILEGAGAICGFVLVAISTGLLQLGSVIGLIALGCAVIFVERKTRTLWQDTALILGQR